MKDIIAYEYPGLKHKVCVPVDKNAGGLFTLGGFLMALEEAGLKDTFDMDSLDLDVPMGIMVATFGTPEIRVVTWEGV